MDQIINQTVPDLMKPDMLNIKMTIKGFNKLQCRGCKLYIFNIQGTYQYIKIKNSIHPWTK